MYLLMSISIIADLSNLSRVSSHLLCHNEHMVIFFCHHHTIQEHLINTSIIFILTKRTLEPNSPCCTHVCVCVCVRVCLPHSWMIACLMGPFSFYLSKLTLCNPALTLQNVFCYLKSPPYYLWYAVDYSQITWTDFSVCKNEQKLCLQ